MCAYGHRIYSGSLGFTWAGLVLIRIRIGSLVRTYESSSSIGFTCVCSSATSGPRVRSG